MRGDYVLGTPLGPAQGSVFVNSTPLQTLMVLTPSDAARCPSTDLHEGTIFVDVQFKQDDQVRGNGSFNTCQPGGPAGEVVLLKQ